jgi:hypothetical protein
MENVKAMQIELFHTSPVPIKVIRKDGLFGSFLCFAASPYTLSGESPKHVYQISLDKSQIIEACSLFYHADAQNLEPIVEEAMALIDCDHDTAVALLSEEQAYLDDPEISWELQRLTAECAKVLGYIACRMTDEQGSVYLVDATKVKLEQIEGH